MSKLMPWEEGCIFRFFRLPCGCTAKPFGVLWKMLLGGGGHIIYADVRKV